MTERQSRAKHGDERPISVSMALTNMSVVIRMGPGADDWPRRSENVNPSHPRRWYVYAHKNREGQVFYVGKGTGDRAWSKDRHAIWHHYIARHLGNQYSVEILLDNLNEEQALFAESEWIAHLGPQLVNWSNPGRDFDMDAIRLFHQRRNANRELIKEARKTEKTDLEPLTQWHADC